MIPHQEKKIDVVSNYHEVLRKIEESAIKVGRDPSEVTLVGVSKMQPLDRILPVLKEGLKILGENIGKDLKSKYDGIISAFPETIIHIIGHMQSDKTKYAIEKCHLVQSVDREKILNLLNKRAEMKDKIYPIFLQVDFSNVEKRKGMDLKTVKQLLAKMNLYSNITVRGFMTIAPLEYVHNEKILAKFYKKTRQVFDEELKPLLDYPTPELSMGMSNSYEIAIKNGSTMVRVGTAIFGPRNYS